MPAGLPSVVRTATSCRYCGSDDLRAVLSLGDQPPSNSFLREEDIAHEERYPLELVRCGSCALTQLGHSVSGALIFDNYRYLSSSSTALRRHYGALARTLASRFELQAGELVVDIGCNDGILLRAFDNSLGRVGVEPSNVAEIARAEGLDVIRAFFGEDVAREIVDRLGCARLVTATNVFAHVDSIGAFVAALPHLLGARGVFVAEISYLPDLIDGVLFDTIYHEHLLYLALTPMVPFLRRFGLSVFDVERVPFGASGPAFRVYIAPDAAMPVSPAVDEFLEREERWGIRTDARYSAFAVAVSETRDEIGTLLQELAGQGARIGGYGAPAKGNTLLNYLELDRATIQMIAETNPLKQGLVTPGSHVPIVSEEEFIAAMPEYALLLSWNYVDYFLQNSEYIRRGGRFIVPLPEPRILP